MECPVCEVENDGNEAYCRDCNSPLYFGQAPAISEMNEQEWSKYLVDLGGEA